MASKIENGSFQEYRKGYDSNATRPGRDPAGANGLLSFEGKAVKLWINDFKTDFALSGSTANSYRTRSFFARNFSQVSFSVSCQFPDQQRASLAAEFMRHAQAGFGSSMRLDILNKYRGPDVKNHQRGPGKTISAMGYIKSAPREHTRWIYAPTLVFEFTVERVLAPTEWADDLEQKVKYLPSWKDIAQGQTFQQDTDQAVSEGPISSLLREILDSE